MMGQFGLTEDAMLKMLIKDVPDSPSSDVGYSFIRNQLIPEHYRGNSTSVNG